MMFLPSVTSWKTRDLFFLDFSPFLKKIRPFFVQLSFLQAWSRQLSVAAEAVKLCWVMETHRLCCIGPGMWSWDYAQIRDEAEKPFGSNEQNDLTFATWLGENEWEIISGCRSGAEESTHLSFPGRNDWDSSRIYCCFGETLPLCPGCLEDKRSKRDVYPPEARPVHASHLH